MFKVQSSKCSKFKMFKIQNVQNSKFKIPKMKSFYFNIFITVRAAKVHEIIPPITNIVDANSILS